MHLGTYVLRHSGTFTENHREGDSPGINEHPCSSEGVTSIAHNNAFQYIYCMTKNEIISQIRLSLQHLNISKVILFGSYATGTHTDDSDIDLLVVTNDDFVFDSFSKKMEVKLQIANALNSLRRFADIDLIVHTKPMYHQFLQLDSGFKKEILATGTTIYEAHN